MIRHRHRSALNAQNWSRLPEERPTHWPPGCTWDVLVAHVRDGESYRSLGDRLGISEQEARTIAYLGRSIAVRLGYGPPPEWLNR